MKAITVQQPWAWAIVHGSKNVENRTRVGTWRPAIGQRVAVHAGQRWSVRGAESPLVLDAFARALYGCAPSQLIATLLKRDFRVFEFGAVIGSVLVDDVHPEQGGCCAPWGEQSYIEHGGTKRVDIVHLALSDPQLCEPLDVPGRLGLWTLDSAETVVPK